MRITIAILALVLVSCLFVAPAPAAPENNNQDTYSVWIGAHYTEFDGYRKKVGEYNLGGQGAFSEFRFDQLSVHGDAVMSINGHFYDDQNITARAAFAMGTRFWGKVRYRSMSHQLQQDQLTNMAVRELTATGPGGKMITHSIDDHYADYEVQRQEILTEFNALLSKKNNVRFMAAHRMIIRNGTMQSLSVSHCASCHVDSRGMQVDNTTQNVVAGLQADLNENTTAGYEFGYRSFVSDGAPAYNFFDDAKHPIDTGNAGTEAEFDSRLIYQDTLLPVNQLPKTEKVSNKVRFKSNLGSGRLAASFAWARTTNQNVDLKSDAYSGAINYTRLLDRRTRLIARAVGVRLTADDPYIDLPIFRDGRPGPNIDFSYTRYSSIDRLDATVTAEVIRKMSQKWTVSVLGGYRMIDRDDYPLQDDGTKTKRFIGQLKARYHKGLKYNSSVKYRFEKTKDPFVSGRGLFEHQGHSGADSLEPLVPGFSFIFYFQREDLRYQTITTEPTDKHQFEWKSNWRATDMVNLNLGVRGYYDKNSDLDSLDVKHFSVLPNANINFTPDPRFVATAGYTYNYFKSRGPVAVALFDG